jgi:MHS family proline/betaine transporter-like MFS transporter
MQFLGKYKVKAFIAALLGTIVEYYDYYLYGYMAAVLSERFFPETDPATALMNHFAVFALGFLTKPLGSYIFGRIGDKHGRKYALRWSILGIAIPTTLIGCLPSYQEWGWITTALLIICRIIQGTFVSAEADGVGIFIYETVPKARACLANSLVWISASLGGSMAAFAAGKVLQPHMHASAWRWPFLLGGLLGVITLWFRKYLIESSDYDLYKAKYVSVINDSFFSVLWKNKVSVFLGLLISGSVGGTYHFYLIFWNNYLSQALNLFSPSEACFRAGSLMNVYTFAAPVCGFLADYFKIMPTLKRSFFLCLAMIIANGVALHFNIAPNWLTAATTASFVLFHIPAYVLLVKMFNVGERYRCMSMSAAFGELMFASSSPAIANYFYIRFKHPIAPLYYCAFLMILGFIAILYAKVKTAPDAKGLE